MPIIVPNLFLVTFRHLLDISMKKILRRILQAIESFGHRTILAGSIFSVVLLGYLDYISGFELSFSLFYLFPISITAWFVNRTSAFVISVLSAVVWAVSNRLAGEIYTHPGISYWNTLIRLSFFAIVSLLLAYLRKSNEKERNLSRTDFLTGITNTRAFYELASLELLRAKRYHHPVTVAYIDLDNFKQINDHFGHSMGDRLLRVAAETISTNIRRTDVVARIGGDEFVVLLPETGEEAARIAITKLQSSLLIAMKQYKWDVTFSVGVITFYEPPSNPDELLQKVDEQMYSVKTSGKNHIKFDCTG